MIMNFTLQRCLLQALKSLAQQEWDCNLWRTDSEAKSSRHLDLCITQVPIHMTDLNTMTSWTLALTFHLPYGGCRGEQG